MLPQLVVRLAEDGRPMGFAAVSNRLGDLIRAWRDAEKEATRDRLDEPETARLIRERVKESRPGAPTRVARKEAPQYLLDEIEALDWLADSYERDIERLDNDLAAIAEARRWNRTPALDDDLAGRIDPEAIVERDKRELARGSRHDARLSVERMRKMMQRRDEALPNGMTSRNELQRRACYYRGRADELRRELGDAFLNGTPTQRDNILATRLTRMRQRGAELAELGERWMDLPAEERQRLLVSVPADFRWRSSTKPKRQHRCESCGAEFEASRSHARFCSRACRQRAYRQRKRGDATPDVTPPPELTEYEADLWRNALVAALGREVIPKSLSAASERLKLRVSLRG